MRPPVFLALVLAVCVFAAVAVDSLGWVALAGVLVLFAALAAFLRFGLAGCGLALLLAGVFASPWNGVIIHSFQPGDLFLAAGLALLVLAHLAGNGTPLRVPRWVWVLAVGPVLIAMTHAVFPIDVGYMSGRFHLASSVEVFQGASARSSGNLRNLLRWEVAILAIPAAVALTGRVAVARRVAVAWMLGCTLSALVALTDSLHVSHISRSLLLAVDVSGRQAGLTSQPNNVAVAAALAIPVAIWLARQHRKTGLACLAILLGGTWVSGSRGGAVAVVGAAVATMLVYREGRRWLVAGGLVAVPVLALNAHRVVHAVSKAVRIGDSSGSAAVSDAGRQLLRDQAFRDFHRSPFRGVGLSVITEAHSIYLQLLAAGGLVLLACFLLFTLGAVRAGVRLWRSTDDQLMAALAVSVGAWLLVGLVENQLTDRYLYVPAAVIAGASVLRGSRRAGSPGDEVVPDVRTPGRRSGARPERDRVGSR